MTIKEIVDTLRSLGHDVTVYQRTDIQGRKRGMVIRSIDNVHYQGSKGNEIARTMVGVKLTEYQQEALTKLNKPSKSGKLFSNRPVAKRRLQPLDKDVQNKLKRIQKMYRRKGREYGIPSTKKYRYLLQTKGKAEADRRLDQAEKYVKGIAYEENIEAFILRLQATSNKLENKLDPLINAIRNYPKEKFTEDMLQKLIEKYYDMINHPDSEEAINNYVREGLIILGS